ncbi:hypothetical protein [Sphingobium sp. B8D3D]|uniref:hypothetical protein n=1 Tax=Sphingobium sp. B8D3D TaxID=2940587 RepID=UPI002224032F|nr:hypothetical protein [Sphingobium sp. B8D3D]MCW2414743.1 hypothetical protein [Sphingobium sp. B8D3A]
MRPHDPKDEEPLDLGLFEMMMDMTPEEWDAPVTGQDDGRSQSMNAALIGSSYSGMGS